MGNAPDEHHEHNNKIKGKKRKKYEDKAIADSATPNQRQKSKKIKSREESRTTTNPGDNNQLKKKTKKKPKQENQSEIEEEEKNLPEEENDLTKPQVEQNRKSKSGDKQRKKDKKDKKPSGKAKRVKFSDEVEILNAGELVRGKRFTPKEDELVQKAVLNYIESHGLGEGGLDMVMHCKRHPQLRYCWNEIAASLPHRPVLSVYSRAHMIFERDASRQWTDEEREMVRSFHAKHGPQWTKLAEVMGKHRLHVKDCWRRIGNTKKKKGKWDQEEYEKLYDLVHADLQAKVLLEKRRSKPGMLRDDIPWTAICKKLETRNQDLCCMKWYRQLTSGMVAEGKWSDADDYRLVKALHERDHCCSEDVEWDDLIEGRSGDVCRQRLMQMVKHIGETRSQPFREQVAVLTQRYCPSLLDVRIAFDNMPRG